MSKYLQIPIVIILAITIVLSCTVWANKATDPATYSHTIEVLDHSRKTILGLTAASAVASAAISAMPDDICSSLSGELSDLTSWFLIILAILYLEKYLLTILGAVACYILIPVGCGALLINCFFQKSILQSIGTKLTIFGAALLLVVPASIWGSDQINAVYSASINMTVESANAVSDNLINESSAESEESTTVIDEAKNLLGDLSNSVAKVVEQFKNLLNRFIEATAVMLVTTCLIPIFVILCFVWLVKTLFNVQIIIPTSLPKPKKRKRLSETNPNETKTELALTE